MINHARRERRRPVKVRLAYGVAGLDIDVDPRLTTVVEPIHHPGAADPRAVLRA
jgi:hypothetical protein